MPRPEEELGYGRLPACNAIVRETRRYHGTERAMISSAKCLPRKRADRLCRLPRLYPRFRGLFATLPVTAITAGFRLAE